MDFVGARDVSAFSGDFRVGMIVHFVDVRVVSVLSGGFLVGMVFVRSADVRVVCALLRGSPHHPGVLCIAVVHASAAGALPGGSPPVPCLEALLLLLLLVVTVLAPGAAVLEGYLRVVGA